MSNFRIASPRVRLTRDALRMTGPLFENIKRDDASNNAGAITAGNIQYQAIDLPSGLVITTVYWMSGSTPQTLGTTPHYWTALFDSSLALLRQVTDKTNKAIAATTLIQDNLSSTFTTTYDGLYYIGIMVNSGGGAGVQPTIANKTLANNQFGIQAPRICGIDTNVYTTTAPNPLVQGANTSVFAYVGVA